MLDVALVGTGGMMPLPERHLTSMLIRADGNMALVDCGEGTQVSLKQLGWGFKQIGLICFTHMHADHIAGLPGLLLTIGNAGRTEPLLIAGPAQTKQVVQSLMVISPYLPFQIVYHNFDETEDALTYGALTVSVLHVDHRIPCLAYHFTVDRKGKFDAGSAKALGIPVNYWSLLQKGETVEHEGQTFFPSQVMGSPRKGLKVGYSTDLRPSKAVSEFMQGADLYICEGNYADPDKLPKALEHKHCMFSEAAQMAADANAEELWLTHFSPSLPNPKAELCYASDIFSNVKAGEDRMQKTLLFAD